MAFLAQLVDDVVVTRFELEKAEITIGRHPDNDIIIDDISVSSHHAIIELKQSKYLAGHVEYYISDCGSKNGTLVNERAINVSQAIVDGDVIRVAWNQFKFIDDAVGELAKTAHQLQ